MSEPNAGRSPPASAVRRTGRTCRAARMTWKEETNPKLLPTTTLAYNPPEESHLPLLSVTPTPRKHLVSYQPLRMAQPRPAGTAAAKELAAAPSTAPASPEPASPLPSSAWAKKAVKTVLDFLIEQWFVIGIGIVM